MGNLSCRAYSGQTTPRNTFETKGTKMDECAAPISTLADESEDQNAIPLDVLLDPRSPHVARTPITNVLTHRMMSMMVAEKPMRNELNEQTPTNMLRKRIFREIGLNYTSKELNLLDPRSPSTFIPRTPLYLSSHSDSNGENSHSASKMISLEYSGFIEEASCRNFNEKLANITLDDTDYEDAVESLAKDDEFRDGELAEIRRKYLETNFDFVGDEIKFLHENDPRSPSENVCRTPFAFASKEATLSQSDVSGIDNVSPIKVTAIAIAIDDIGNKNAIDKCVLPMCSSTPTVLQPSGENDVAVLKAKNLEKMNRTKIYEDEREAEDTVALARTIEILATPLKKFTKPNAIDEKPRTPLSIVNRRTKSAESLAQRQSRLRATDTEKTKNTHSNAKIDENFCNENYTPRRSLANVNKNPLSVRSSCSKIPILKK